MNPTSSSSRPLGMFRWVVFMGALGFCAGFFGPIALNPYSNQGPMTGIFISGPLGLLLGFVLYFICRSLRLDDAVQWKVLLVAGTALTLTALYIVLPEPAVRGHIVEVEVQACGAPSERIERSITDWEKQVAKVTWAPPRAGWQAEMRRTSEIDIGVVVDVLLVRQRKIFEQRKPWNRGKITADSWQTVSKNTSYYVPSPVSCADFKAGSKLIRYTNYDISALSNDTVDWPPKRLSDFMNLQVLEAIPSEVRLYAVER